MSFFYVFMYLLLIIFSFSAIFYLLNIFFSAYCDDEKKDGAREDPEIFGTLVGQADHIVPYIIGDTAHRDVISDKRLFQRLIDYRVTYNFNFKDN